MCTPNNGTALHKQVHSINLPEVQPLVEKPVHTNEKRERFYGTAGHQRPDGSLVDESYD